MKVLVYEPFAIYTPHYETTLEIIQLHLDSGDEVTLLGCDADLPTCDANACHNLTICKRCIKRRKAGIKLLSKSIPYKKFLKLNAHDIQEVNAIPTTFSSIDEIKRYRIENFDIGYAALSSLISQLRDPEFNLTLHADLLSKILRAALYVYRSIQHHIDSKHYDLAVIFNGRMALLRGAVRACESRNIPFVIHERGQDIHHYALYQNSLPHDIAYNEEKMRAIWQDARDNHERETIAAQFYQERANGVQQSWFSYTKEQTENYLPDDWDERKKNIGIFNSSEDEFAAIGEQWKNPLYLTQLDGLRKILSSIEAQGRKDIHFYLRIHPNLKGVDNASTRALFRLSSPLVTTIPPESPVSSYSLLRSVDIVLTFGSTVGIEAVYWRKPSILAGTCFYRNLGGTYNPATHEELILMLTANLEPKDAEAALIYGYYLKSFGIPFKYVEADTLFNASFKGKYLDDLSFNYINYLRSRVFPLQQLPGRVINIIARRIRNNHPTTVS